MNNEKLMIANKIKGALLRVKGAPFMLEAYLILKRTAS